MQRILTSLVLLLFGLSGATSAQMPLPLDTLTGYGCEIKHIVESDPDSASHGDRWLVYAWAEHDHFRDWPEPGHPHYLANQPTLVKAAKSCDRWMDSAVRE